MTGSKSPSEQAGAAGRALAAVMLGALIAALLALGVGDSARRSLFDLWQRQAPRQVGSERVAVILIDPVSLEAVGGWPWPRYYLARLTEQVAAARPRVIAFDMIFPEADRLNPDHFAALYPELGEGGRSALGTLPTMDSLFAQTIGSAPVLLGRLAMPGNAADPAGVLVDPAMKGKAPSTLRQAPEILSSIPELDDVALAHALLNGPPDGDGVVRRVPLAMRVGGQPMPGLAIELARIAEGAPALSFTRSGVALGRRVVPGDERGDLRLWFGRFPDKAVFSAARVLAGDVPPAAFAGKVVLVGLGAEGSADLVATPGNAEGYGVFVQAQAVDSILAGEWLDRPPWALAAEWMAGALLVALVLVASVRGRRWLAPVAVGAVAIPLLSWVAFREYRLLVDPVRPDLLAAGAVLAWQTTMFARTRRERARLAAELVDRKIASARQEGELEAARSIQLGMVPSDARLAALDPRVDLSGQLDPARSVGGDFYDAAMLDADRMLLVIGDVTGKGVPAALYMALSKGLAKSILFRADGGLGEAVGDLNRELLRDADETMGVTLLIAILDCRSGALEMVCAGHENPIVRDARGNCRTVPLRGGPPLCVVDFPYQSEAATLEPAGTLVLITDGVTEAQDVQGRLFGVEGALEALAGTTGSGAANTAKGLRDSVRGFEGDTEPSDDLTILAAVRHA